MTVKINSIDKIESLIDSDIQPGAKINEELKIKIGIVRNELQPGTGSSKRPKPGKRIPQPPIPNRNPNIANIILSVKEEIKTNKKRKTTMRTIEEKGLPRPGDSQRPQPTPGTQQPNRGPGTRPK